ncbi:MAG: hypothetical protein IPM68_09575 [Flavobacteriales bacterium]|nr:hypothetical protein [Flavobacteriales bacterium]
MSAFPLVMLFLDLFKWFIPERGLYHAGLRVVPILMLANVFLGIYYNQSVWRKLTDRTRAGSTISIVGAAITLACLSRRSQAWATWARPGPIPTATRAWQRSATRGGRSTIRCRTT